VLEGDATVETETGCGVTLRLDDPQIAGGLESNITELRRRVRDAAAQAIALGARGPGSAAAPP
jgi:hypothetical protein